MLYSLMLLLRPDAPLTCYKVKCVDRQHDSTDREKRACSSDGFQHVWLLCIYIAVAMSNQSTSTFLFA